MVGKAAAAVAAAGEFLLYRPLAEVAARRLELILGGDGAAAREARRQLVAVGRVALDVIRQQQLEQLETVAHARDIVRGLVGVVAQALVGSAASSSEHTSSWPVVGRLDARDGRRRGRRHVTRVRASRRPPARAARSAAFAAARGGWVRASRQGVAPLVRRHFDSVRKRIGRPSCACRLTIGVSSAPPPRTAPPRCAALSPSGDPAAEVPIRFAAAVRRPRRPARRRARCGRRRSTRAAECDEAFVRRRRPRSLAAAAAWPRRPMSASRARRSAAARRRAARAARPT